MRGLLLATCLLAAAVRAQSACESKCGQQATRCLETCTGDPAQAQDAGATKDLVACVRACDAEVLACKAACRAPAP